jgi:hypothetical protein
MYSKGPEGQVRLRSLPSPAWPFLSQSEGWELAPLVELPIRSVDFEGQSPGTVVAVVPLICRNCAFVVFSSAVAMGVLAPGTRPGEPSEP